jgi:hypothetical protein
MKILNNLIEDLLSRSQVNIKDASFTIGLRTNAVSVRGEIPVTVVDTEKPANPKPIVSLVVPVQATIQIDESTFPIPTPK